MPAYQLWIENWAYTKQALIARYTQAKYRLALNAGGFAEVTLAADAPALDYLDIMDRFKIIRDGVVVFGGVFQREEFKVQGKAPAGSSYDFYAKDHAEYANWRVIVPEALDAYDERTDHADDLAKDYVYYHIGAGAAVDRQLSDVAVEADEHAAASITERGRYEPVMDMLDRLQKKGLFDWRFVPGAAGCVFQTAYPNWGLDRTKGNGVNDECVFSLDRKSFVEMTYTNDLISHRNVVYVLGDDSGADRVVEEWPDAGAIADYRRREIAVDARKYGTEAELQAEGDAALVENEAVDALSVVPKQGTWRGGSTSGLWDLGDLVTCYANRHGRTWSRNAKVVAVDVDVDQRGESVKPTLQIIPEEIGS